MRLIDRISTVRKLPFTAIALIVGILLAIVFGFTTHDLGRAFLFVSIEVCLLIAVHLLLQFHHLERRIEKSLRLATLLERCGVLKKAVLTIIRAVAGTQAPTPAILAQHIEDEIQRMTTTISALPLKRFRLRQSHAQNLDCQLLAQSTACRAVSCGPYNKFWFTSEGKKYQDVNIERASRRVRHLHPRFVRIFVLLAEERRDPAMLSKLRSCMVTQNIGHIRVVICFAELLSADLRKDFAIYDTQTGSVASETSPDYMDFSWSAESVHEANAQFDLMLAKAEARPALEVIDDLLSQLRETG